MKIRKSWSSSLVLPWIVFGAATAPAALAEGKVIIPESSIEKPEHVGKGSYAHTHYRSMSLDKNASVPSVLPAYAANPHNVPASGYS